MAHRDDGGIEYACLAYADGRAMPNPAKHAAFERFQDAVRAAGGRAPIGLDGEPMVWNAARGWFDRTERRDINGGSYGSPYGGLQGDGWRVLDAPFFPHADLENLAREIWPRVCRWSLWPDGWSIRFAELTGRHCDYAAVTLFGRKLILIDEENWLRHGNLEEDLRESILHEFAHVSWGRERDHDPHFYQTLAEMRTRCPRVIGTWSRVRRAMSG